MHASVEHRFIHLFHVFFIALCYRSAKAYDKAIEAFERASDAYYKNHAYPFHAYMYQ